MKSKGMEKEKKCAFKATLYEGSDAIEEIVENWQQEQQEEQESVKVTAPFLWAGCPKIEIVEEAFKQ